MFSRGIEVNQFTQIHLEAKFGEETFWGKNRYLSNEKTPTFSTRQYKNKLKILLKSSSIE